MQQPVSQTQPPAAPHPNSGAQPSPRFTRTLARSLGAWFDADSRLANEDRAAQRRVDWLRVVPFLLLHAACFAVIWVGFSWTALAVAIALYVLRAFALTAFYHRYFSHRAFATSRVLQFVFAAIGASAVQRGPLWWAAHHRHHHAHADSSEDVHSPRAHGFLWSHAGWFMARENFRTRWHLVEDFARYPELRFLDRFDLAVPALLAASLYFIGEALARHAPALGTNGAQLLVWGFFVSTVFLYHVTFMVNSVAHRFGRRRYATRDDSRNNVWVALLTLGEGWHNNHHHFPGAARHGFFWWELDLTYFGLRLLKTLGLVWDLRFAPAAIVQARRAQ
jgi:stearoyl-CoA desaturase (Delta-9 desaturase)